MKTFQTSCYRRLPFTHSPFSNRPVSVSLGGGLLPSLANSVLAPAQAQPSLVWLLAPPVDCSAHLQDPQPRERHRCHYYSHGPATTHNIFNVRKPSVPPPKKILHNLHNFKASTFDQAGPEAQCMIYMTKS